MVPVDDDEREVALELAEGLHDRLGEVAVVEGLDQVRDRLRVRLRAEGVPILLEPCPELAVVLDDPVQHDRQLTVLAGGQRVRVALGHRAVRRPARVAETGRRLRAVRRRGGLEELEVPDGADIVEAVVFQERDAGGVVAAVLESLEAVDQEWLRCSRPDVSDDSAHGGPPSLGRNGHPSKTQKSPAAADPVVAVGYPSSRRTRAVTLPKREA